MPRYKLSSEERPAEKERKENLRNIMKGLDVKNFDDLEDVFKMMVGEMLENGLDGELDDELGYTKYDYRNKEGENSRNGYSKKTLKTSFGETEIKVPRDRDGEFEPQLVKKNQTTLTSDIEEKTISMYRNIFLRHIHPIEPLTGSGLHGVLQRYFWNSGINIKNRKHGPHSLRHSLATNLLDNNTLLPTISDILRHKSTTITQIYLKVDISHLKKCALPVLEGGVLS